MNVAKAIASWHFAGLQVLQFWGVSYAIASVALTGHLPFMAALVLVSAASSAATTILAGRLWGWQLSAVIAALNFDWMQRSLLGGSEPLFMLLLLGAFIAVRMQRWWMATLLASLATTTRPLGICALFAIGIVLLHRKDYQRFICAVVTGMVIGALYVLPLHLYLHDGLATVHSYEGSRPLFGIPFHAILQGTYARPPLTNLLLSYFWITFIIGGIILISISDACREYRRTYPVEFIFSLLYTLAICCYNDPHWALGNFARFAIPAIPFALVGWKCVVRERNPVNLDFLISRLEPAVWTCAVVFPGLAAFSAYGIRNLLR